MINSAIAIRRLRSPSEWVDMVSDSSSSQNHDYTEGASAVDIQDVLNSNRRSRRDSQYGEGGYMFDGPGHTVNPSSVSRMTLSEHGRRSSEGRSRGSQSRRRSEDRGRDTSSSRSLRASRDSLPSLARSEDEYTDPGHEVEDEGDHATLRRSRRKSTTSPQRQSVFGNIASMFGRAVPTTESPPRSRRPSLSSRSSRTGLLRRTSSRRSDAGSDYAIESDDEDERWGYASEEEDDSESDIIDDHRQGDSDSVDFHSIEEDSYPPSPGLALHTMTGPGDPIFGDEARIDMGELDLHDPPPPGPPSRQTIYITDEDVHIRFIGFETVTIRHFLWRMACVLTFGILGLLGHWFPRLWLRWVAKEKAFKDMEHGFVVIEVCLIIQLVITTRNEVKDRI